MALQLWPFAEIHNNFHKIRLCVFLMQCYMHNTESSPIKMKYKRGFS